jgi:hypothetical protein
MYEPTPALRFAEDKLQILSLCFMAAVYVLKIRWILSFPAAKERQASTADRSTDAFRGARHSLLNVAMPWEMASTRRHPLLYVQFVIFHVGVAVSILMSFLIPYAPGWISGGWLVWTMRTAFAAAFLVGIARLVRRLSDAYVRSISTPDDYFSLGLLLIWFAFSFAAATNRPEAGETWLLTYFYLTAFFLIYVPFSKISHYIYYPFARWYLGRTLGHRGVYPVVKEA